MPEKALGFVHLHVHSEYSMLDGLIRLPELVKSASEYKMPAVAITDHGNIFGAVEFYEEAMKARVKPIIGCEVYMARASRQSRNREEGSPFHLVLLCQNEQGYKNLCQLITLSYLEGFYFKPRIDRELLEKYGKGLLGLSGCLQGEIPQLLLAGKNAEAEKKLEWYQSLFGSDNFYLELQENGLEDQGRANQKLVELAGRTKAPLVCSNDCHYLKPGGSQFQNILLCIQQGKKIDDPDRFQIKTDQLYFRSGEEMKHLFRELPQAVNNTLEIAGKCEFFFELGKIHLPKIETSGDETPEQKFEREAREGFEKRIAQLKSKDPEFSPKEAAYRNRFEHELKVITKAGFAGYFLIVADFINFARRNQIPVGPGRGSAAGSLAAYALGITNVDPIRWGLIFERFLNPERREMPDIDVDFCQERRPEVIRYVSEKYGGETNVVQLITFQKLKARAVIRDVGRVLNFPLKQVDLVAKLVPKETDIELAAALKQEPQLQKMVDTDPKIAELFRVALQLEGLSRNPGTHAAGVVVSDKPITEYMPLYKKDVVTTQFTGENVARLGIAKFDMLGLLNLTVIDQTVKMVSQNRGVKLDMDNLPLDDPKVFALFSRGETVGVFQMKSQGMTQRAMALKPSKFEELIANIAFYRPGPLGSKMDRDFIDGKHGRKDINYILPQLEEILKETYGVILYQEQVMQIAAALANYTMGEADMLRKAMGKKDAEIMEAQREPFVSRCQKNGLKKQEAEHIFELIKEFAGYGFNKSHSTVYALIAYQTAYLKCYYPVEYLAAYLTSQMDDIDEISPYLNECERMKIEVLPPHINTGGWKFTVQGGRIIYGLAAVKNVGKAAVEEIVKAREQAGPFSSIFEFCERADLKAVNRKVIESLVKAGAFDKLGAFRSQMLKVLDQAMESGQSLKKSRAQGQEDFFSLLNAGQKEAARDKDRYPEMPEWEMSELLGYEKEVLGHYLSGHPMVKYQNLVQRLGILSAEQLAAEASEQNVIAAGMILNYTERSTRQKERMAIFKLEDLSGRLEVIVYPRTFLQHFELFKRTDKPVIVRGKLRQEETTRLIAEKIMTIDQALEDQVNALHISVSLEKSGERELEALKETLREFPGRSRVVMHLLYPGGEAEAVLNLPDRFAIKADMGLVSRIDELFGENSARLEMKSG